MVREGENMTGNPFRGFTGTGGTTRIAELGSHVLRWEHTIAVRRGRGGEVARSVGPQAPFMGLGASGVGWCRGGGLTEVVDGIEADRFDSRRGDVRRGSDGDGTHLGQEGGDRLAARRQLDMVVQGRR
jgi:hypothetical protein